MMRFNFSVGPETTMFFLGAEPKIDSKTGLQQDVNGVKLWKVQVQVSQPSLYNDSFTDTDTMRFTVPCKGNPTNIETNTIVQFSNPSFMSDVMVDEDGNGKRYISGRANSLHLVAIYDFLDEEEVKKPF